MDVTLFVQIEYQDRVYYVANGAFTGSHTYYPFLYNVPNLGVGGDGFSKVTTGQLSLIRSDDEPNHPFSQGRYYSLIEKAQQIPFRLYYDVNESPIFSGNLTLDEVTEDELKFLVVEEEFQKSLVYPVLDRENAKKILNFYLFQPDGTKEFRLMFSSEAFNLSDQTEVILERTYSYEGERLKIDPFLKLDYQSSRDNRFLIGAGEALMKRVMLVDPEDQSRHITIKDLLEYRREGSIYYATEKDLLEGNSAIDLDGMGFNTGYDADGDIEILETPLPNTYQHLSDGGTELYSYYDLMGIQQGQAASGKIWKVHNYPQNDYYIGTPVINPFTFGTVNLRDPVVVFGDRKLKRDFDEYSPTDPTMEFKPDSVTATVLSRTNREIFAYSEGQSFIQAQDADTVTTWSMQNTGSSSASTVEVYNKRINQWVNINSNSTSFPVYFEQIRFNYSSSYGAPWYGNNTSRPTNSNYTMLNKIGSSITQRVNYTAPQNIAAHAGSGWYYEWTKDSDSSDWGDTLYSYSSPYSKWSTYINPISGMWTHHFYYNGITIAQWTTYLSANAAAAETEKTHNGINYRRNSLRANIIHYNTIPYDSNNKYIKSIQYDGAITVQVFYNGSMIANMHSGNVGNNTITWDTNQSSNHMDFSNTTGPSINGYEVKRFEPSGNYQEDHDFGSMRVQHFTLKITFKNVGSVYDVQKYSTVVRNTGTMKLWMSSAEKQSWTSVNRPSWDSTPTYPHTGTLSPYGTSMTVTKSTATATGGNVERFMAYYVTTTQGGWTTAGSTSDALGFVNNISGSHNQLSASGNTLTASLGNNYSLSSSTAINIHQYRYEYTYSTTIIPAVAGRPYIANTNAYHLDDAREKIYERSREGAENSGFPSSETDLALGAGWADGRNFSSSNAGYYLSQIFIENGVVYESENKTKVTLNSGSSTVNGVRNLPQMISFNSIQKSSDVPANVQSDYFRIYRTDNKAELRDVGVVRIKPSNKPALENVNQASYTATDGTTYYSVAMEWTNLDLSYDSDPNVVEIKLECYAGSTIEHMIFYDANDEPLDGTGFPDGSTGTMMTSMDRMGIPRDTQKIWIKVKNDEDKVDEYAKRIRGFDAFLYQRIFPVLNASSASSSKYAIVGVFEVFDEQGGGYTESWHNSLDFNDMFNSGSGGGSDAFPEATDELAVYSIRNPHLFIDSTSPRVFDDGVELGVIDDLHGEKTKIYRELSDEDFIHLSVNPFGQVAVSGTSIHGTTIKDFFSYVSDKIEDEKVVDTTKLFQNIFNEEINIDMAANAESAEMQIPIYQSSEITVMEMADKVAKATNHQFYFRYGINERLQVTRTLILIDINYVFNQRIPDKTIRNFEIVSMRTDFPFPIKAFESTLTRNISYTGLLSQNSQSVMKSVSSNYRVNGTGVGNVQNFEIYAEDFEVGRYWLNRKAETDVLPITAIEYNGIDMSIHIGSKISFSDEFRKVNGSMIVQEIAYNFVNESTLVKGISEFSEIIYT